MREKLVIGTTPGNVNCLHILKGEISELSSFRRMPESSVVVAQAKTTLDPGMRRGDEVAQSDAARGFADLLSKFRNWQKP